MNNIAKEKVCNNCKENLANEIVTDRPETVTKDLKNRLSKIEGQVKGVSDMIVNGRYCHDVLTQVAAIQSALTSVSKIILENHIKTCITRRLKDGDTDAVQELMQTLKKIF